LQREKKVMPAIEIEVTHQSEQQYSIEIDWTTSFGNNLQSRPPRKLEVVKSQSALDS